MKRKRIGFWASFFWIYQKDSLGEWRHPYSLLSSLLFAVILAAIYSYALTIEVFSDPQNFGGIVLAALFFSTTLSSAQGLRAETEAGALRIINMSSLDPAGIYLAKVVVHWQSQMVFIVLSLPVYFLFLQGRLPNSPVLWLPLLVCLSLCAMSLAALGTLLAYVSVGSGLRAVLLPLLLLPAAIPVLLFALSFLTQVRNAGSLAALPLQHYLVLIAPATLYAGIGSLLYFNLAADTV